ncbi:MAG: hypothetical protein Q7J07_06690 [Pelolinea sp.]|nr:hypothetical protein [Pelolinea sp.]
MKPSGLAESPLFQNKDADTKIPGSLSSNHATMPPDNQDDVVEYIRQAVRHTGKEAGTYRITREEKKALLEICYSFRLGGIRTSENEITRIALNYLLYDHKSRGENSILGQVIEAIHQ